MREARQGNGHSTAEARKKQCVQSIADDHAAPRIEAGEVSECERLSPHLAAEVSLQSINHSEIFGNLVKPARLKPRARVKARIK
jgi:hypothetical protein